MKTGKTLIGGFILGTLLSCSYISWSQINTGEFIYGGIDDASALMQEYFKPYANILGANLNSGWYTTARPHKLGGLDIMANVSVAFAPAQDLQYDLAMLALNANVEGSSTIAPTAAGSLDSRPSLVYNTVVDVEGTPQTIELARFTHPNGSGYNFFPTPMLQLSLGLPFGTDISVRYFPGVEIMEFGELELWGVGAKHSVSQYIPVIKKLKFFDISLQGGYTQLVSSVNIDVNPLAVDVQTDPETSWDDQYVNMELSGWTANLLFSETLPVISFYQAIGYSSSACDLALLGHYPINTVITEGADIGKTTYNVVENPIELEYTNSNNLRYNAGVRITLGIFMFYYDFTHTLYTTHTGGFGITFR